MSGFCFNVGHILCFALNMADLVVEKETRYTHTQYSVTTVEGSCIFSNGVRPMPETLVALIFVYSMSSAFFSQ